MSLGGNINFSFEILSSALDLCTELVQIESSDGVVLYVNAAWCNYFGEERDNVIGVKLNHFKESETRINEIGAPKEAHTDSGATDSHAEHLSVDRTNFIRIPFKTHEGDVAAYITAHWPATTPKGYISVLVEESQLMSTVMRYRPNTNSDVGLVGEKTVHPENLTLDSTVSRRSSGILTNRECEVLRLLSKGLSNIEVANELVISISTVKTHVNNIFRKLKVTNRTQAFARGVQMEII